MVELGEARAECSELKSSKAALKNRLEVGEFS